MAAAVAFKGCYKPYVHRKDINSAFQSMRGPGGKCGEVSIGNHATYTKIHLLQSKKTNFFKCFKGA